jgi:hypothetical protein
MQKCDKTPHTTPPAIMAGGVVFEVSGKRLNSSAAISRGLIWERT